MRAASLFLCQCLIALTATLLSLACDTDPRRPPAWPEVPKVVPKVGSEAPPRATHEGDAALLATGSTEQRDAATRAVGPLGQAPRTAAGSVNADRPLVNRYGWTPAKDVEWSVYQAALEVHIRDTVEISRAELVDGPASGRPRELDRELKRRLRAFQFASHQVRSTEPFAAGTLVAQMVIQPNGTVTEASAVSSATTVPAYLEDLCTSALRRLRFPPASTSEPVRVQVGFKFISPTTPAPVAPNDAPMLH